MELRKTAAALAEINITPLIDVLLVLLIIFMVVAPVAQRALDVGLPEQKKEIVDPPPTLVLDIEPTGLMLNRTPIARLDDLEERLRSTLDTRADKTLFVRSAGDVGYGRFIEVLDVARGAGVGRIGILASTQAGS